MYMYLRPLEAHLSADQPINAIESFFNGPWIRYLFGRQSPPNFCRLENCQVGWSLLNKTRYRPIFFTYIKHT